jgi:hypothetical protein
MSDLSTTPIPGAKKSRGGLIALIVILALVVIGVGGWFLACSMATKEAKMRFEKAYAGTPFEGLVTYEDFSATPLGDLEIGQITVTSPTDPNVKITIEKISVSASEGSDDISGSMDMTMTGLHSGLDNLADFNDQPRSDFDEVRELGYDAITVDMTFAASNDAKKGETALSMGMNVRDMMSFGFSVELANTDLSSLSKLNELSSMTGRAREKAAEQLGQQVVLENAAAKLADLSADVDIEPLYQRVSAKKGGVSDRERELADSVDPSFFILGGQTPEQAQQSANAIKKAILEGKALHLRTNIEQPILFLSLSQPNGPLAFAQALGFTISN